MPDGQSPVGNKSVQNRPTEGAVEEFAALMLLGIRVRKVEELDERALFFPQRRLLLIDSDLDRHQRAEVAATVLPQALAN